MVEDIKSVVLRIVERMKKDYKPKKIILFGSYVDGNVHRDSDIDLLVVKDSKKRRDERDKEIRELLKDVKMPMDIFVYTPDEVRKFHNIKGSFINKVFNTGEVVYERS